MKTKYTFFNTLFNKFFNTFFVVFLLFSQNTFAQNTISWETLFASADAQYAKGAYTRAIDKAKDVVKTIRKKYNDNPALHAYIPIFEVRWEAIQGNFGEMNKKIQEISKNLNSLKDKYPDECAVAYLKIAEIYTNFGFFVEAENLLKQINTEKIQENTKAIYQLRYATLYTSLEKLNEASKNIPESTLEKWANTPKSKTFSKQDIAYYKTQLSRAKTLKGEIFTAKGNYKSADSLFKNLENFVKKNALPVDLAHFYTIWGNNFFEQDKHEQGEDYFKKAIGKLNKKQYEYLIPFEKLIKTYIQNKDESGADKYLNYWAKYSEQFNSSEENPYYVRENLLLAERSIFFKEYQKAIPLLEKNIQLPTTKLPSNHILRLKTAEMGYEAYANLPNGQKNAEIFVLNGLNLSKQIYGENAPITLYHQILTGEYYALYREDYTKAQDYLANNPEKGILEQRLPLHKNNLRIYNIFSHYYDAYDQYKDALEMTKKATEMSLTRYGKEDLRYGLQLSKIAELQLKIGQYKEAESNMKTASKIIKQESTKKSVEYADALSLMAKVYATLGNYDEAEDALSNIQKFYRKNNEEGDLTARAKSLEELAFLYIRNGDYVETEELLTKIISQKEQKFGKNHRQLMQPYNQIGNLYLVQGDYTQAQKYFQKAEEISKKIFGENSLKTVECYVFSAKYNAYIGDYHKAEKILLNVIDLQKTLLNENHVELGKSYQELAMVKFYDDAGKNMAESEILLTQARKIMQSNFDDKHPLYADVMKNMGEIALAQKKYDKGLNYLEIANAIWLEKLQKRNIYSASVYMIMGDIYAKKKDFSEAKNRYQKAETIYKKILNEKHPDYVRVQSKMAQMFFANKDYKKANELMEITTQNYLDFVKIYFPALSEREKAKFWAKMQPDLEFFNNLVITQAEKRPELLGKLYNLRLATKALLLNSSQKMRKKILSSKDENLIQKFHLWAKKSEEFNAILSFSPEQLQEKQLNPQALQDEIEKLEKELSEQSEDFANSQDKTQFTWEQIKDRLDKNEFAVETIRYRLFDQNFVDSVYYAFLVISPETKRNPKLILMQNGNKMEKNYLPFYQDFIKHKQDDEESYNRFWSPLAKNFEKATTVYFSPDGLYNQLNPETLRIDENNFVIDKYNVRFVSNIKDLLSLQTRKERRKNRKKSKENIEKIDKNEFSKNALLCGNPTFYSQGFSKTKSIGELPGTEAEIQGIADILRKANYKVNLYHETQAEESILKNAQNIGILHLATHGFFQEQQTEENFDFQQEMLNDPLRKSGILMRNAGELLATENQNFDAGEGILTAQEAMALTLDGVDLVVLSACETGAGKVAVGEGVYGLQRAFLVAGANSLIMSLFKVNDEVTQLLLTTFYEKWISSRNKRKAFREAQLEIKQRYPEPIYWGAFNMIGVE